MQVFDDFFFLLTGLFAAREANVPEVQNGRQEALDVVHVFAEACGDGHDMTGMCKSDGYNESAVSAITAKQERAFEPAV